MEFRILGPLEVLDDGRQIELPRAKQRALLVALLLRRGETVSVDRLIECLWGATPPRAAKGALQNLVAQLRQILGRDLIVFRPPGYALVVRPEQVDSWRFERLVEEARGEPADERAALLREALALWRGSPLDDLGYLSFARVEIDRLEELREAVREDLVDAELERGRHADLVGELEKLVAEHPLRERLRGQLMRALYCSGRQAEALGAYQDARRTLVDELGIEPNAELRELHQAILRQDASLCPGRAPEEPRLKTVTALLADISCVQAGRRRTLDAERMREAAGAALAEVRAAVEFHGGKLVARAGDEALGVFGIPAAHEDDALRAVRAATDMRTAVGVLSDTFERARHVRIELRVGIATGEALVEQGEPTGEVVVEAKRLARRATAAEIVLSLSTQKLVGDAGGVEEADGVSGRARRLATPLVGRTDELAALRSAFDRAVEHRSCVIVPIVGEAGVGKTRLAKELAAALSASAMVLTGRCVAYGEGATFLPVVEMIEQVLGDNPEPRVLSLLAGDDQAEFVAQRIGAVAGRAGIVSNDEVQWVVRRLFAALAAGRPLVLVFEDVHWGEPALLDLIERLGRGVEAPILVLPIARPELLDARPDWAERSLRLAPLSAEETNELLDALGTGVAAEARQRVVEISDGNPLYAEQLVGYLAEEGALETVPPSLDALLSSRLDLLDGGERAVLQRAAVAGREFWRGALVALSDRQDVDALSAQLLALERKGLVEPARSTLSGEDAFRFHHVLIRDAAYAGIPKAKRADLHERFADWLDERPAPADELVGYHLEQAYRYGEGAGSDGRLRRLSAAAGTRLAAAGIRAWKRGDAAATVNLLGRATSLLPERDALRREAMCELGVALRTAGDVSDGAQVLDGAVDASIAAGDRRLELRARIELAALRCYTDPEGRADELVELASAAIPTFEALEDHRSLGRTWLLTGYSHSGVLCRFSDWAEAAENAAQHYRASGWSPSSCLGALAAALYNGPVAAAEAIRRCEEILGEPELERGGEASVLTMIGGLQAMLGEFDRGRDLVRRAREIYRELGREADVWTTCGWIAGDIEVLAGESASAAEFYAATCRFFEHAGHHAFLAVLAGDLADALYAQGLYAQADRWTRISEANASTDDVSAHFSWRSVRAKVLARQGKTAEAERLAREALRIAAQTDGLNRRARVGLDLAEVLRLGGGVREASKLVSEALSLYERKGNAVAAARVRSLQDDLGG